MSLIFQGGKIIGTQDDLRALMEAVVAIAPKLEVSFNDVNMVAKNEEGTDAEA